MKIIKTTKIKFFACFVLVFGLVLGSISTGFALNLQANGNFSLFSLAKSINPAKFFATQTAKADDLPINTLMEREHSITNDIFFNSGFDATTISSVYFKNETPPDSCPSGESKSDAGVAPNESSVILCVTDDASSAYNKTATFYATDGVVANPISRNLFFDIGGDPNNTGTIQIDWANFDTEPILDMSMMFTYFGYNSTATTISISDFPAGFGQNTTNMDGMFFNFATSAKATTISIPQFPEHFGENANILSNMFAYFEQDTNIPLISVPTFPAGFGQNATYLEAIFRSYAAYSQAGTISIPNFPANFGSKAKYSNDMFHEFASYSQASTISIPNFPANFGQDFTDAKNMFILFEVGSKVNTISIPNFPAGFGKNLIITYGMFAGFGQNSQASTISIPNFPAGFGSNAINMTGTFESFGQNSQATTISIPQFPESFGQDAITMEEMFANFETDSKVSTISIPTFPEHFGEKAVNYKNMFNSFAKESQASTISIPNFPAGFGSKATDMYRMFSYVGSLNNNLRTISIPTFPSDFGSKATDMSDMFYCFAYESSKATTTIDLSLVAFSSSSNTTNMFAEFSVDNNKNKLYISSKTDYDLLTNEKTYYKQSLFGSGTYYVPQSPTIDTAKTTDTTISFNKITKENEHMLDPQGYNCTYKKTTEKDYKQCEIAANQQVGNSLTDSNQLTITKLEPDTSYNIKIQTKVLVESKERLSLIPENKEVKTNKKPTPNPNPTVKKYKVSFNPNGGKQQKKYSSQLVENNKYAKKPPNPKKKNYTFAGWYKSKKPKTKDKKFDFKKTKITKNISLYALWVNTYKIINLTKVKKHNTLYIKKSKKVNIKLIAIPSFNKTKGKYFLPFKLTIKNKKVISLAKKLKNSQKTNSVITIKLNTKKRSGKTKLNITIGSKTYAFSVVVL